VFDEFAFFQLYYFTSFFVNIQPVFFFFTDYGKKSPGEAPFCGNSPGNIKQMLNNVQWIIAVSLPDDSN